VSYSQNRTEYAITGNVKGVNITDDRKTFSIYRTGSGQRGCKEERSDKERNGGQERKSKQINKGEEI